MVDAGTRRRDHAAMSHAPASILPDSVRDAARLDSTLGERLERDFVRLTRAGDALVWAQRRLPAFVAAGTASRLLGLLVGEAKDLTQAPIGLAVSWSGDVLAGKASFRALAGDREAVDPGQLLDPAAISSTVVGQVVRDRRPAWSDDAIADKRFESAHSVQALCIGLRRLLTPRSVGRSMKINKLYLLSVLFQGPVVKRTRGCLRFASRAC